MTLPPPIKDERVAPYNPFPNNDISALDEGRFDYPSSTQPAKIHDRSGKAVSESVEDETRAGGRIILACLDFHREDHLQVRSESFDFSPFLSLGKAVKPEPHGNHGNL